MKRRVVVTGIGALTPIGNNPQELWESVKAGKCGIDFIKNFDTSNHKVKIAAEIKNFNMDDYIEKRDAKKMDTYCQYAIVSAKQAFADSGLDIEKINPERSLSNGMEARFGLLHSVSAFIEVNPPIPSSVTEASEPPVHIISAYPSRI